MSGAIRPDWIAVDWGTSHVRAWAMSDAGAVLAQARSADGMGSLPPAQFEPALLRLIGGWELPDRVQVFACGMVGARQGWAEAPYVPVPVAPGGVAPLVAPCADPRLDLRILPGLSQMMPPDVMRGEETQIAGFLAREPGFDGVLCLPGTHTKWAEISAGEVVSFRTAMTGELFSLLAAGSVLRHMLEGAGWDDAAFAQSVDETLARPEALAVRLFAVRAKGLLRNLDNGTARAKVSGLLIGAELAALRPYWLGRDVAVVGAAELARIHALALERQGLTARIASGDEMALAGLTAARARWRNQT